MFKNLIIIFLTIVCIICIAIIVDQYVHDAYVAGYEHGIADAHEFEFAGIKDEAFSSGYEWAAESCLMYGQDLFEDKWWRTATK